MREAYARARAQILGGILGNLSGAAVVGFTLLVGLVLGALGGFVGAQAARLLRHLRPESLHPVN